MSDEDEITNQLELEQKQMNECFKKIDKKNAENPLMVNSKTSYNFQYPKNVAGPSDIIKVCHNQRSTVEETSSEEEEIQTKPDNMGEHSWDYAAWNPGTHVDDPKRSTAARRAKPATTANRVKKPAQRPYPAKPEKLVEAVNGK